MFIFPLIHVAVGLGLTYFVLATFLNKTDILITPYTISVRSYPLKWFGNKELDTMSIRQLYVKRIVRRTKNGESISYDVRVELDPGRDEKLISGLQDSGQARFIEQKIESVLALTDRPVDGELRKS